MSDYIPGCDIVTNFSLKVMSAGYLDISACVFDLCDWYVCTVYNIIFM